MLVDFGFLFFAWRQNIVFCFVVPLARPFLWFLIGGFSERWCTPVVDGLSGVAWCHAGWHDWELGVWGLGSALLSGRGEWASAGWIVECGFFLWFEGVLGVLRCGGLSVSCQGVSRAGGVWVGVSAAVAAGGVVSQLGSYGVLVSVPLSDGEPAEPSSAVCGVRPELVSALQAQGRHGQRALRLLLDAAHVLNRSVEFCAPYEVAQSCLRGALDSVLRIAGEDFPGLRSATRALTEAAGAVADAWRHQGWVGAREMDVLVGAVEGLRAEQAERCGFRTRQIGRLVAEQSRQEMGLAETEAARSWSAFYSAASGVLHGSSSGADEARRQFMTSRLPWSSCFWVCLSGRTGCGSWPG